MGNGRVLPYRSGSKVVYAHMGLEVAWLSWKVIELAAGNTCAHTGANKGAQTQAHTHARTHKRIHT